jgi:ubiquinone biosynthesis protein
MDSNPFARGGANGPADSRLNGKSRVAEFADGARPGPERLTRLLIRLGPTFIKIGQFLSLRPDILPQDYCDELLRLVDRAPSTSWEVIRQTLHAELGDDPEKIFARISKRPLAAGSIAQVHLAETHQGEEVAIKVQRPDLPARVKRDLRKIRWLARALKVSGIAPFISPAELVSELERWLKQELDFTKELNSHTRMYEEMTGERNLRVPQPFAEYSSPRVITTEYLRGTPFSDLIRLARSGDFEQIENLGFDREVLAERLIETTLHQIFRMRFFHADLHPGNIIAMSRNVIGLVDFGLTDVLDPTVEDVQFDYLVALYESDTQRMYRAISQIFVAGENTDAEAFRRDFFIETNRWLSLIEDRQANGGAVRSPTAGYMVTLMRLARAHDMSPPTSVLSMYRTLLTSESVAFHLGSEANLREVGRGFFRQLQLERIISSYHPDSVIARLMQLNELASSGPSNFQQLLSDVAEGRFVLSVRSLESAQGRRQANQRARLIALAILAMSLTLLLTLTAGQAGTWELILHRVLWVLLIGIYIWLAIIWRRLR